MAAKHPVADTSEPPDPAAQRTTQRSDERFRGRTPEETHEEPTGDARVRARAGSHEQRPAGSPHQPAEPGTGPGGNRAPGTGPGGNRAPGTGPGAEPDTGPVRLASEPAAGPAEPAAGPAARAAAGPTLDDVLAAQKTLAGVARVTAMEGSRHLTRLVGAPVHLKCENLQRTGSFKVRGAYTRIAGLSVAERAHGVVAASAGNHAQGVALAAGLLGVPATVFMPVGAPLPKIAATRDYGAQVRLEGQVVDESLAAAREHAERTGAVLIHPFDHRDVVAGQGTIGLEILEQCPEVRTIVLGMGGGGLAAGVAVAVKSLRPDVRIVGVQAEGAAAYPASLAAGEPVALAEMSTMADGIQVGCPGEVPFRIVAELVDEVCTVSEDALSAGLLLCLERAKLVVEPSGASPVAALLTNPEAFSGGPVVAVLSGGNVDPLLLERTLRHGMAAAGRYLSLRLRLPDRPGALAALLTELSVAGANVLAVNHVRIDPRLGVSEVEVELQLETQGPRHRAELNEALRSAGYRVLD